MFHTTLNRVRHQRAMREAIAEQLQGGGANVDSGSEEAALSASTEEPDFDNEGTLRKMDKNANVNPPVAIVNPTVKGVAQKNPPSEDLK